MANLAVRMSGIVKRFPGVLANDHVDFEVAQGEIHALVGENGAGKSTLVNVLGGLYRPDEGHVRLFDQPVVLRSPAEAIALGVGMVHQQFMLVPTLTVAENIVLGLSTPRLFLSPAKAQALVTPLLQEHALPIDPAALIWQLSVAEQQRVEILKVLHRGARILVLDEPTAVLSPPEVSALFQALRSLAAGGRSVVLITHKLEEVLALADRISVLRKGKMSLAGHPASTTTREELAEAMVGRPLVTKLDKTPCTPGDLALEVRDLQVDNDRGLRAVRGLNLQLRAGEILGVAGVAGGGQREFVEAVAGLRAVVSGTILLGAKDVTSLAVRERLNLGLAYVPEDRAGEGSVAALGVDENLVLKSYRRPPYKRGWWLDREKVRENGKRQVEDFDIAVPSAQVPAGKLSGGNLQKVILARELALAPNVLLAAQPTRGLDLGATHNVHQLLLQRRSQGGAVLLISEDLEELLSLSDRVLVLFEGAVVGEVRGGETSVEQLGLMLGGAVARGKS